MHVRSPLAATGLLLALAALAAGCSNSDEGAGPEPTPTTPPVIDSFLSEDAILIHGEFTRLRWRIQGAAVAAITRDQASVPPIGQLDDPEDGAVSIRPHRDVTYTLIASNDFGTTEAQTTVQIRFPAAFYVDPALGDDANPGDRPDVALRTLSAALARTQGGGAIFLAAGNYPDNLIIDGAARSVYGGLDPVTFFEDATNFHTVIRPAGGTPIVVRNVGGSTIFLSHLEVDARNGGDVALEIDSGIVVAEGCLLNARESVTGRAVSILGDSDVRITGCRIQGGRPFGGGTTYAETAGIVISGTSDLLATNCFIDGGIAFNRSSGVDVASTGSVRLGLNTISAQITQGGASFTSAAVRIRVGTPAIGGNILFTQGAGQRYAVLEEDPDADPSHFEGNLVVAVGTPPYRNDPDDSNLNNPSPELGNPANESQLNDHQYVNFSAGGAASTVILNRLVTGLSASQLFPGIAQGDYHLAHPMPNGDPNPARNAGDYNIVDQRYGPVFDDIDGDRRPSVPTQYDLGADEL